MGSLLGGLGTVASFIPGMQAVAPILGAAGSLMNGDVGGAMGQAAPAIFGEQGGPVNQGSTDTWQDQWNKQQEMNYDPAYDESLLMRQWMKPQQQMLR